MVLWEPLKITVYENLKCCNIYMSLGALSYPVYAALGPRFLTRNQERQMEISRAATEVVEMRKESREDSVSEHFQVLCLSDPVLRKPSHQCFKKLLDNCSGSLTRG